ncbi:MAG: iron-containing alcohol dehydrogenase [Synergistaceae bacterium]|nr:iron-containing alcohol dehydrogenase [Synergistaceae bacterium]
MIAIINVPTNIEDFVNLKPWWRTEVPTEVILSANGIEDLLIKLKHEKKKPFFILDSELKDQQEFAKIFAQNSKFIFDASASEPRTDDVDKLVAYIKTLKETPTVLVGIGGGSTIDLTKATSICYANPKKAQEYQGYEMEMEKGIDIWALPTLSGTGAEITPIAVLRGPEKKLGINNKYTAADVAIIDPQLSSGATTFNRFFTMMDCYYHHYEITKSKTSNPEAILDAKDGVRLSREILSRDVEPFELESSIKAAMASILGGSSTIGGRVGAAHAISYGLSNSSPCLPHSIAVTISMLALETLYPDGYKDTVEFLKINNIAHPKASDYEIGEKDIDKMTNTAMGMGKLWDSAFGEQKDKYATEEFMRNIYIKIINQ